MSTSLLFTYVRDTGGTCIYDTVDAYNAENFCQNKPISAECAKNENPQTTSFN